jgi:hypothetical protein
MNVIPLRPPRGIRLNNPGNLKEAPGDKTQWIGERAADDDPIFEEFESPIYGIRALAKVLLSYYRRHHLKSVGAIISRWAPPSENDTLAYVAHVAQSMGVLADQELSIDKPHILRGLLKAIIKHENGIQPYSDAELDEGISLALKPEETKP